jgi:hypothetical protein
LVTALSSQKEELHTKVPKGTKFFTECIPGGTRV